MMKKNLLDRRTVLHCVLKIKQELTKPEQLEYTYIYTHIHFTYHTLLINYYYTPLLFCKETPLFIIIYLCGPVDIDSSGLGEFIMV